jgi:tetrahydromethanopterin S-methyltransferase subunit C
LAVSRGKSVCSEILNHDIDNVARLTFPVAASYFDPRVTGLLLWGCEVVVTVVWGADTFRRTPSSDAKR